MRGLARPVTQLAEEASDELELGLKVSSGLEHKLAQVDVPDFDPFHFTFAKRTLGTAEQN